MTIGDRIKAIRIDLGMTQEDLAKLTGTTKQTIYKYEQNIVTNIPTNRVEQIAQALHTTPVYLMGWDEVTAKEPPALKGDELPRDPLDVRLAELTAGLTKDQKELLIAQLELMVSSRET